MALFSTNATINSCVIDKCNTHWSSEVCWERNETVYADEEWDTFSAIGISLPVNAMSTVGAHD